MTYEIRLVAVEGQEPRQRLLIIRDGVEIADEIDMGEPEDNMFFRDWHWVKPALEAAYKFGLEDGKALP